MLLIRFSKALNVHLMLLQLKLSISKNAAVCETYHLFVMCNRILQEMSFCVKAHDV